MPVDREVTLVINENCVVWGRYNTVSFFSVRQIMQIQIYIYFEENISIFLGLG